MELLSMIQQSRAPTRARTLVTLSGNPMSHGNGLAARLEEPPDSGEVQRDADDAELIEDVLQAFSRDIHPPFSESACQTHHARCEADAGQDQSVGKLGQ